MNKEVDTKIKQKFWSIVVTVIALIIIFIFAHKCNSKKAVKQTETNYAYLLDSMKTWRNKDSSSTSRIRVLEIERLEDIEKLAKYEKDLDRLAALAKQYKDQLKKGGTVATIDNSAKLEVRTIVDTFLIDDLDSNLLVTFTVNQFKDWVTGKGSVINDSVYLDLIIKNKYNLVIGEQKDLSKGKFRSLFRPKLPFADITNLNPYTDTETIRVAQVKTPTLSRSSLGVSVGYGFYADIVNRSAGHGVIGGITYNYRVIGFKKK